MKVVQCVESFPPEPTGGIQAHLCDLAPLLIHRGVTPLVAASIDGRESRSYEHAGMQVFRYPVHPPPRLGRVDRGAPHEGFVEFARWLERQDADVYAQHRWSNRCGLPHLRHARRLGLRTVVHVHLPEPLCARETLMLGGVEQCDGRILLDRCSHCLGLPRPIPAAARRLATGARRTALVTGALHRRTSSLPGLLRAPASRLLATGWVSARVGEKKAWLDEMAELTDAVVVMSSWTLDAFVANGFPRERLHLIPSGTRPAPPEVATVPSPDRVLRVGFIGRMHPDKGVDLLVRAVLRLPPHVPVRLLLHVVGNHDRYEDRVRELAGDDPRIVFAAGFGRDEQAAVYSHLDVVAVPSQWLETGPLVALEAHAHGVPVLGSRLGGLAERVHDGVDGLLLPHADEQAWAEALRRLATEPGLLERLRDGVRRVRTLDEEADALVACYRHLR